MAEEIIKTEEEQTSDSTDEATDEGKTPEDEGSKVQTFTGEEVEALIKSKVDEATKPLLSQIQRMNETTFALEMTKANLNLNDAQKEVLKDYTEKRQLSDVTSMVELAKELFGASLKEVPPLTKKDMDEAFDAQNYNTNNIKA